MPYVYSTASASTEYTGWVRNDANDFATPVRSVVVNGGANVANKHLITPVGVVTKVTDEELEFLESHDQFKLHMKNGFITVDKRKLDAEVKAADMERRDKSAPLTPNDFEDDNQPVVNGEEAKPKKR